MAELFKYDAYFTAYYYFFKKDCTFIMHNSSYKVMITYNVENVFYTTIYILQALYLFKFRKLSRNNPIRDPSK